MPKYNKRDDYSKISWEVPESIQESLMGKHSCPVCKKTFFTHNKTRRYCSPICAQRARRKNQKNRGNSPPNFIIFARDGFRCHYCGKSPHREPEIFLVVDHIIPLAKGGTLIEENLITCCNQCNATKHDRLLDTRTIEFLKS